MAVCKPVDFMEKMMTTYERPHFSQETLWRREKVKYKKTDCGKRVIFGHVWVRSNSSFVWPPNVDIETICEEEYFQRTLEGRL